MFKKSFATTAVMLLALSLFCTAAFAKVEIKLSNQLPPSHHISKGLVVFSEKVAEYSGGDVTVRIFDSAQLFKDTEIVEALQDGLVEAGLVPVNKWSGMIPAADIFEMPFVFKDFESPKKFLNSGADKLLDGEFQKKGVKNLFWVDYGYIQFFNNKRPLKSPEDFKGLTMRTFSSGDAETLRALGAAPGDLRSGVDACLARFAEPGVLDRTCASPLGFEWTVGQAVAGTFMDVLIHTWDLAAATGQDSTLDAELVAACAAMFLPDMPENGRAAGLIGPAVEVGADATPQQILLGALGRQG